LRRIFNALKEDLQSAQILRSAARFCASTEWAFEGSVTRRG
jgi:hypothetical protein